jgi:hypothetical protein
MSAAAPYGHRRIREMLDTDGGRHISAFRFSLLRIQGVRSVFKCAVAQRVRLGQSPAWC